jgi:general secretion pathway protein A
VQAQAVNDLESSADQTVEDVETETGIDKKAGVASRPQTSAEAATTDPAISNKPDNALKLFPITSNRLIIDFSHNSNDFTETAYQKLDSLAIYMVEKPEKHVVIKGYTDSNGDYSYNKSLSVFRANIVKSYLIGKGVPIARIVSVGMGAENPVGDNNNVQGRRANRRVEIEILESDF